MYPYILYNIFSFLIWPIIIIGIIVFFIGRRRKKARLSQDYDWYLQLAFSKEDAVGQLFFLLSFFFLGVTLLAFNKDFGDPFAWHTIVFFVSALGLAGAYYLRTIYLLVFSLVGLTSWWSAEAALWVDGKDIKTSALFTGLAFLALLFYSLGHLHEIRPKLKRFALVYSILGIIAVTGILFFFSTKVGLSVFGAMTKGASILGSWQLTASLAVFLASLLGTALYSTAKKLLSPLELLAVLMLACLFGITALLPEQTVFIQSVRLQDAPDFFSGASELSSAGILWASLYNIAVFFELLGLIFSGYVRRETWLINLGALFLFLLIIAKYFDWFFSFLDKSIFFIGAGILLFVVGWFMERGRKYMISSITEQPQQIPH